MKFKGQVVKGKQNQYTLKQQLSQGGFSIIYTTNLPEIICKVQVLSIPPIMESYRKQKQIMTTISHPNMVRLYEAIQLSDKGQQYGFLMLQNCSQGTAFDSLQQYENKFMPQKMVGTICYAVASLLQHLHAKGISHRDIKMENILKNAKGQYKICDFGSASTEIIKDINQKNRSYVEQFIQKTTTPLYRSPEQLDLYSGFQIGPKVDVFALGVLAFMLCFQKPPFEGRLAAINNQFFIPEEHNYSANVINIIRDCFTPNPDQRPSAKEIRVLLNKIVNMKTVQLEINYQKQLRQTQNQMTSITQQSLKNKEKTAERSLFQKIRLLYSQFTTETQGWIAGFIQDNQESPPLKYNRYIIKKCWQKRYKIAKFLQIVYNTAQQNKQKCLVTVKMLTLVHNFLRKGPKQAITYQKEHSVLKLCCKIYKNWKYDQKINSTEDIKRNPFMCILIRNYSLLIIEKTKLCYQNSHLFEANYSIIPFLSNPQDKVILEIPLVQAMLTFLQNCTKFHEEIQKRTYLIDIQRAVIFSMVDQEYCLFSTLTFIYCTFKKAIPYVKEELDLDSLLKKVQEIDNRFTTVFKRLSSLFTQAQKYAELFEQNQFQLKPEILNHVLNINITKKQTADFNIVEHLNYKIHIFGLRIPLTYEQVVNNPNFLKDLEKINHKQQKYIQVNKYKLDTKPNKQKKSPVNTVKQQQANKNKCKQQKSNTAQMGHNFDSFVFNKNSKQNDNTIKNVEMHKQVQMMQFTHQNLNKDFNTCKNNEQFKDFMSIVDCKIQKEEPKLKTTQQTSQNGQQEMQLKLNVQSGCASPSHKMQNNPALQKKVEVNRVELINFFDDDDEPPQVVSSKQEIKTTEVNKDLTTKNNLELQQVFFKDISKQEKTNQQQESKQNSQRNSNNNLKCQSIKLSESFIDLKGFVVEEVKRNAEQYVIDFKALKFKEKVGYGNSSEVFRGQWRGRQVAIKKIKDEKNCFHEKQFRRQIMTSVRIRHHPHLVTLIGVAQDAKYYYLISEFCDGSTLFDLLHESEHQVSWKTRVNIAKQIARGMLFLHTNEPPIIHRDLKSLNVLTNKYNPNNPGNITIKIADFGLSRDFASTYMTGALGTYHWMAPQIFNNEQYSLKADVYSFGIVLWQIAARSPPYLSMKNHQSLMKFVTIENGRPDVALINQQCPWQLKKLMAACWEKFPSNRPNFHQILNILDNIQLQL